MDIKVTNPQLNTSAGQNAVLGPGAPASAAGALQSSAQLSFLRPGQQFTATIVDIERNSVTIRFASGETLTARSEILPDARIGDAGIFIVKESFSGQILLQMMKRDGAAAQTGFIKEALENAELYPSRENTALARELIANGIPVDAQTLQKAAFFLYAEQLTIKQVVFLLQENFPANMESIRVMKDIIDGNIHLKNDLAEVAAIVNEMRDSPLKGRLTMLLMDLMVGQADGETADRRALDPAKLLPRLFTETEEQTGPAVRSVGLPAPEGEEEQAALREFKLTGQAVKKEAQAPKVKESVVFFHKKLYESVVKMLELVRNSDSSIRPNEYARAAHAPEKLAEALERIKTGQEFMNQIENKREYMQLPFHAPETVNQAELHVFRDRNREKDLSRQASVLIGLDCAMLGRVEVYINRADETVSLQFRGDADKTLQLIRQNAPALQQMLKSVGFTVKGVKYRKLTEPFVLADNPDEKALGSVGLPKRYAFDMRV